MTTKRATFLLRCSRATLYRMAQDSGHQLRNFVNNAGKTEWNDADVLALAGLDPAAQLTVAYARVEPAPSTAATATRLEQQKQRLVEYSQKAGLKIDLVIGEVRRVNRVRDMNGEPASGFNTLLGLATERRLGRLVIESRDRVIVGASWEMFEWILKSLCGTEIVVLNSHIVTTDAKEESKAWLQDALTMHKLLTGELRDTKTVQQFTGGLDAKLAKRSIHELDKRLRERQRDARNTGSKNPKHRKKPLDLADVFDGQAPAEKAYRPERLQPQIAGTP